MPFAAAISTAPATSRALEEVCARAREQLQGPTDLALLFFSAHHHEAAAEIAVTARQRLTPRCLLGCIGESIIGNGHEIEGRPAVSLWLGRWPRPIEIEPCHLTLAQTPDGDSLFGWPDGLLGADPLQSALILLGEPSSFPVGLFLRRMNEDYPGVRVVGGMASGIEEPGQCRLVFNDQVLDAGAVGVLLQGPLGLRTVVSQGCKPVGRPLVVTRGEANVIAELGGKPSVLQLKEIWDNLGPRDQQLFQHGLHIGLVMNEYQGDFRRGDFLVRNVLGLDRDTGAVVINDHIRVGQTVQFHIRDADTADQDLHELLQLDLNTHQKRPAGALLFSCNGRGSRLFSQPHHDARAVRAEAGEIPLAGFFAQGELGPVGGQNFIHGFTASVALFEE
jgi:small ligand-binding sensory domain FIST